MITEHVFSYLPDIHYLAKYYPDEVQYTRYVDHPEIIATAHKVMDVYRAQCNARSHLVFFQSKNWGDILPEPNDKNILFVKQLFCSDALVQYNICIDLSWQVLWANWRPTSIRFLLENGYFDEEKNCNLENLNILLEHQALYPCSEATLADELKEHVNVFFNAPLTENIRSYYNYIKHCGIVHFPGLGLNLKQFSIIVNKEPTPCIHRPEIDLDALYSELVMFDITFCRYFDKIINDLFPTDYLSSSTTLWTYFSGLLTMAEAHHKVY